MSRDILPESADQVNPEPKRSLIVELIGLYLKLQAEGIIPSSEEQRWAKLTTKERIAEIQTYLEARKESRPMKRALAQNVPEDLPPPLRLVQAVYGWGPR